MYIDAQAQGLNAGSTSARRDKWTPGLGATGLFDERIDELLKISNELLTRLNVFHLKLHFSGNQLICWTYDNPYSYVVFTGEQVFDPYFMDNFSRPIFPLDCDIHSSEVRGILNEFKRLRQTKKSARLCAACINRVNGLLGMTFARDDNHYLPHHQFLDAVRVI